MALHPTKTGPSLTAIVTAAVCTFLIILMLLAWQVQAGMDPVLGTTAGVQAGKQVAPAAHHHAAHVLVTKASGGG